LDEGLGEARRWPGTRVLPLNMSLEDAFEANGMQLSVCGSAARKAWLEPKLKVDLWARSWRKDLTSSASATGSMTIQTCQPKIEVMRTSKIESHLSLIS
jgi:hypothetical protein